MRGAERPLRLLGIALLAAGALLWLATSLVSPFPTSPYALDERAREGPVEGPLRVAVSEAMVHSYDAERDLTRLFVATCNHSPCGAVVTLDGDWRARDLRGPWLLVPRATPFSLEPVGPPDENAPRWVEAREDVEQDAYTTVFDVRSPAPPFLARALAVALAVGGATLAARPRWTSLAPAGAAALLGSLAMLGPGMAILIQIGGFLGFAVGAVWSLVEGGTKARLPVVGPTILLVAVASVAVGIIGLLHFPGSV